MQSNHTPRSKHFQLEQLTDGVYAAISLDGTGSGSNAGIIDLGDRTLIFDTFKTPQAAQDLRDAAEHLTRSQAISVINSHMHFDHVLGNQIFIGAPLFATSTTRELIETKTAKDVQGAKEHMAEFQASLLSLEEQIGQVQDEASIQHLRTALAGEREYLSALPTLEIALPNVLFEQRLVFHGTHRTAELLTFGGGHTVSDAFLYLPEERLLFMGDLLFVKAHPMLVDGNPEEWVRIVEQIKGLAFDRVVPGHGPVGTREDLALLQHYITTIVRMSQKWFQAGKALEEVNGEDMPAPFNTWSLPGVFPWNMHFLYERLAKGTA